MRNRINRIAHKFIPNELKMSLRKYKIRRILSYYKNSKDPEIKQVISNLLNDGICMFPYSFTKKYSKNVKVSYDEDNYPYVKFDKKKLFFPKDLSAESISTKYNSLLCEQDENSPHKYFTDDFRPKKKDLFFDIGSAEAMISLSLVNLVEKIYVFEYNRIWTKPLNKTFNDFKDTVKVVDKFVTNNTSENTVAISDFMSEERQNYFFKIDVEGEEMNVLKGMDEILDLDYNIRIAICTYHNGPDFEKISSYLDKKGFLIDHSKGYMLFDQKTTPYLRRGVLRASKTKH